MAQRQLKSGWVASWRVNRVSWPAQSLFMRLVSLVDDFARFEGHPAIIARVAFPLGDPKGRPVTEKQAEAWLLELDEAKIEGGGDLGLISRYQVGGVQYLCINRWTERVRAEKSRFPGPPWDQMLAFASKRCQLPADDNKPGQMLAGVGSCCSDLKSAVEPEHEPEHERTKEEEGPGAAGATGGGDGSNGKDGNNGGRDFREAVVPSDREVFEFCDAWPGEMASGAPKMSREFAAEYLKRMTGRREWPANWQRNVVAVWRAEFREWDKKKNAVSGPKKNPERWKVEKEMEEVKRALEVHPALSWPGNRPMEDRVRVEYEGLWHRRKELEEELKAKG